MIAEIDCASASYLQNIYGYHLKMVKAGFNPSDVIENEDCFLLHFEWNMLEKIYRTLGVLIIAQPQHDDRADISITIYDDYIE